MKTIQHQLIVAARILSLLLIITPILLPLAAIPHALIFTPEHLNNWVAQPPRWDALYLLGRYFSEPIIILPSLAAISAGLWLFISPLSWKNGIVALIVAVPWFFLLSFNCFVMLHKVALF